LKRDEYLTQPSILRTLYNLYLPCLFACAQLSQIGQPGRKALWLWGFIALVDTSSKLSASDAIG
jgi:hypothetical protein